MNKLLELECACATIRRAARLVTQVYSHEIGGGVEPTQFALLTALSKRPGATQSGIGRALGLDKTTMSRNLRVMEKHEWIEAALTEDQRERGYRLTAGGRKALAAAKTGWRRAQRKLRAGLRPGEWESMMATFDRVAAVALEAEREAR